MIRTSQGLIDFETAQQVKRLESRFDLPTNEQAKTKRPTIEMLTAIADFLRQRLQRPVNITQAWQIWIAIYEVENRQRLKATHKAEVSFWFGVNAYELSEDQFAGLYANLPKVKAQKQIQDGKYDPTDYETVYQLFLLAYDDEQRASKARAESLKVYVDQQTKKQS